MALSSPKTAILLARSVFAQATGKRSQGSRSEESRHEKGKDAAKVRRQHRDRVENAPRFSSDPASSTGSATLGASVARAALSSVLTDFSHCGELG
jgi:hypothetical protein